MDLKTAAGLDSYAVKLLHGDWITWNDPMNQVLRMVSPQGFAAGRRGNLSPEQSSLNKQLYGPIFYSTAQVVTGPIREFIDFMGRFLPSRPEIQWCGAKNEADTQVSH